MPNYEELYEMIYDESVKGTVGRSVLKGVDTVKKGKEWVGDKADKVKEGYNKLKNTKGVGPVISGAEKASTIPFTASSGALAKGITKGKEVYIKSKYSNDPEKMEKELKKNVENLSELKSDIMALEIWTLGWPMALKTAGLLDNIFKGVIGAGAVAKGDTELISAVAKATLWVPAAAMTLSKILKKEVDPESATKFIKNTTNKLLSLMQSWAKSDQPLFIAKKGPQFKSAKITKKENAVKECVSMVCEGIMTESITYEEAAFLMELLNVE